MANNTGLIATCALVLVVSLFFVNTSLTGNVSMEVGLQILPIKVEWENFTHGAITPTINRTATTSITTYHNDTRNVTVEIPAEFTAAGDFTVVFSELSVTSNQTNVTRSANTLSWQQDASTQAMLQFTLPSPVMVVNDQSTDSQLQVDVDITALTPLRRSTYDIALPQTADSYILTETTAGNIDRTQTYNLQVSGQTAVFEDVAFSVDMLSRSFTITGSASDEAGSDDGAAQESILLDVPETLSATTGSSHTAQITIHNGYESEVVFSFSADSSALEIVDEFRAPAKKKSVVDITYLATQNETAELTVSFLERSETFTIQLEAVSNQDSQVQMPVVEPTPQPPKPDEQENVVESPQEQQPAPVDDEHDPWPVIILSSIVLVGLLLYKHKFLS